MSVSPSEIENSNTIQTLREVAKKQDLTLGTVIKVLGVEEHGGFKWYQVKVEKSGRTGWINSNALIGIDIVTEE